MGRDEVEFIHAEHYVARACKKLECVYFCVRLSSHGRIQGGGDGITYAGGILAVLSHTCAAPLWVQGDCCRQQGQLEAAEDHYERAIRHMEACPQDQDEVSPGTMSRSEKTGLLSSLPCMSKRLVLWKVFVSGFSAPRSLLYALTRSGTCNG